jgi:hypothetical protein
MAGCAALSRPTRSIFSNQRKLLSVPKWLVLNEVNKMNEVDNNSLCYSNIANDFFERAKYSASDIEIKNLAKNIWLLKKRGLTKLNRRLIEGGRNVWDTLSEHNFAVKLLSLYDDKILISYEPDELQRPPDFKIEISGLTYWVQIKRLSNMQRENRRENFVETIKREAKKIQIRKFIDCYVSEEFSETDIPEFMKFIEANADQLVEGKETYFPDDKQQKAKVGFWCHNKSEISHLILGAFGDMEAINITGCAENQIKQSLEKASGAFTWDVDQYTINIVAFDADKHDDIALCNAIFGTEFENDRVIPNGVISSWSRYNDGFIKSPNVSNKIAGVIVMRRKERNKPLSDYCFQLFVNDIYKDRIDDLKNLLDFNKVIYRNMRPVMGGNGYFELV